MKAVAAKRVGAMPQRKMGGAMADTLNPHPGRPADAGLTGGFHSRL